jgi:hypothetical protein
VTEQENGPQAGQADGQATVNLALQVANVAAQVSAAMRSDDEEKREELDTRLALAQARLVERQATPEGLTDFLTVMRGLLSGEDVSTLAGDLPVAYRAVYWQLVGELEAGQDEGELTVGQVLDEVTHNVILALVRGTYDQQRRMADTLSAMEQESSERPDLDGLRDLLHAARLLLLEEDPTPVAQRLTGPFKARWDEILKALQDQAS